MPFELVDLRKLAPAIQASRLIIAGFTGRDESARTEHIRELESLGVPPPERTPTFYELPGRLVTFDESVTASEMSSGEVEPVLLRIADDYYVTVGSDHTDRAVEASDGIAIAKMQNAKPLSFNAIGIDSGSIDVCSSATLRSWCDGELYQEAEAATLVPLSQLLESLQCAAPWLKNEDIIMFGGTPGVKHGVIKYGCEWRMQMSGSGIPTLSLSYETTLAASRPMSQAAHAE